MMKSIYFISFLTFFFKVYSHLFGIFTSKEVAVSSLLTSLAIMLILYFNSYCFTHL